MRHAAWRGIGRTAVALLGVGLAAGLARADTQLLPGKSAVVRAGGVAKLAVRPPRGERIVLPALAEGPQTAGATLRVFDVAPDGAGDDTYLLPAAGWRALGRTPGRKGFRYRGAGTEADPCRLVVVKPRAIKAVCGGRGMQLVPPFAADVGVVLTIGAEGPIYCTAFGGRDVKNRAGLLKRRRAAAPALCPGCRCGTPTPSRFVFTSGVGSGACGTVSASPDAPLACGGLYFGGGGIGSVVLPATVPDTEPTEFRVTACTGADLAIESTSIDDVGGTDRRCTSAGCLFGPPLPLPNPISPPTSTCLVNVVAADAVGQLSCETGEGEIDLPLETWVYLTGDSLPNRCSGGANPGLRCASDADCPGGTCAADPELQPCAICNPVTGVCNGGMNNGLPCTPGSEMVEGAQFPGSHDCPIGEILRIGELPINFALTTGTATSTAVPSGTQDRVFCGYCRDADDSLAFQGPPAVACTSDAECAPPFESCEQMDQGAFHYLQATTVTEVGSPAGPLVDGLPHPQTLVSVFCVPPTYNGLIDNASNLPGPGAVSLQGTAQLGDGSVASAGAAFLEPDGAF